MPISAPRRLPRRLAGAVVLTVVASTPVIAQAQAEPGPGRQGPQLTADSRLLDGPARGEAAIRRLGDDLRVAAARNGLRPAELRSLLRSDRTARLDVDGLVHFVEPALDTTGRAEVSGAAVAPLDQTFFLHSNPGASLTILLDVDGAEVSGTRWNDYYGITPGSHPAWDPAHDGPDFSDTELAVVQKAWAIVAEDYAPFDVDVTTEDPGDEGLVRSSSTDPTYGTRVLVSPSADPWSKICQSGCGGVATLSVFGRTGSYYQPAWVFPQALGDSAKNVGEAASHEAGHNLGLSHDGTSTLGYYTGHGSWAPIMGVGYDRPVSQWSHGSYPGANNPSQDDVAVLTGYLGLRMDEAPGPLGVPAALPSGSATISEASDVDTYLLGTCTSGSVVTVTPAAYAPDLDVEAVLRDAGGSVVATSAPASGSGDGTTATGLGATLTVPSDGVGWTVSVDGVGQGSWSTNGYDDYGSLGAYTVRATGCQDAPLVGVPSIPLSPSAGSAALDSLTLAWDPPADPGDGPVTGYVVGRSGTTQTWSLPATARSHVFTGLAAGLSYDLTVHAVNATGAGPRATATASTLAPPPATPSAPRSLTASYDPGAEEISVSWAAPTSSGTEPVTGYAVYLDGVRLGEVDAASRGATISNPTGFSAGTHTVAVAAVNAVGESARATASVLVARPATAPAPPTLTSVVGGNGTAIASWAAPASNGSPITGYTVIVRTTWENDRRTTVAPSALSTTLSGLTNRVTYLVTITATNAAGTSAESPAIAVVPDGPAGSTPTPTTPSPTSTPAPTPTSPPVPAPVPATPAAAVPLRMTTPKVVVKGRKAVVSWTPATSPTSAVRTYLVDLSKGTDRSARGSARRLTLTKLRPGRYKVRVAALNATGWSPFSGWVKLRIR